MAASAAGGNGGARSASEPSAKLKEVLSAARAAGASAQGIPVAAAGRVLGDFRLLRPIGRGGMGTVWEAEQISLGRKVALKLLAPQLSLSEDTVARFRREAAAGGRLSHPGIVGVHDVGEVDGTHFIAQELVGEGFTLGDFLSGLQEQGELPEGYFAAVAELFAKVADALQAAHDAGVVHRDVKPSNILITENDEPKVADFGLARVSDDLVRSRTMELAGTPYYMSPEQAMSKAIGIDARTDVFSLGVTLYEALALRRAFEGDTSQQVLEQILLVEPPDPRKIRSRVPRDLAVICRKAMEKRRQNRYASMADFAADLRRYLADEPIVARPPGPGMRAVKWMRRHPALSLGGAVATVAFVIVAILLLDIRGKNTELGDLLLAKGEALTQATDQRLRADAEAEHAREEAARAKVLVEFTESLFRMERGIARPEAEVELGDEEVQERVDEDVTPETPFTLAEILEGGLTRIHTELEGQPLVQARLLGTIADIYFGMSEYERARPLYEEALEGRLELLGEEAPETWESLDDLGRLHHFAGRNEEASLLFIRVFEARTRVLGVGDESVDESVKHVWEVLKHLERHGEFETFLRGLLEAQESELGLKHPATLTSLERLAYLAWNRGRIEESESLYRQVLSSRESSLGPEHRDTLRSRKDIADVELALGREKEARDRFLAVLETRKRVLGVGDTDTQDSMADFAALCHNQGDFEESVRWLEELLSVRSSLSGGAWGTSTSSTRANLLHAYTHLEHWGDARTLVSELLEAAGGAHGSADVVRSLYSLARRCVEERLFDEAEQLLGLAHKTALAVIGPDKPLTLEVRHELADLYRNTERPAEAVPVYPVEERRRVLGVDHADTLESMDHLADTYVALERYEEAEQLYLETIELAEHALGEQASRTMISMEALAWLYSSQERFEEAVYYYEQAVERMTRAWGQKEPRILNPKLALVDAYRGAGQVEAAEALALRIESSAEPWSPGQATGVPDITTSGDSKLAWASMAPNGGEEWLELDYASPFVAHQVRIHETDRPGAVVEIILEDEAGDEIMRMPVDDYVRLAPAYLELSFELTPVPVKRVRIVLDTAGVSSWNEIDAVELVGPKQRAWAAEARASSYYRE